MGGGLPQPDEREQAELSVAGNLPTGGDLLRTRPTSGLMRVLLHQMVCASTHRRASESGLWARFVTRETYNLWQGREELSPALRSVGNLSLRIMTSQHCFALEFYVKQRLVPAPNARPCRPVVSRQAAHSRWVEDFVGGDAKSAEGRGVQ